MLAYTLKVYGIVQRVGYRRYVLDNAQRLGVHGYVKNESDGSVTIFVQGNDDKVNEFIDVISNPPRPAIVTRVEREESDPIEYITSFSIRYGELAEELQEGFGAMQSIFMSEFNDYRTEFKEYRSEFKEFRSEFDEFRSEFKEYRSEFKEFTNRTDQNFNDLKGELKEFREETKDNFKELREELRSSANRTDNNFKELKDELRSFANNTDNNFNTLLTKYGEISAKLTMILDELRKEREESSKRWEELSRDLKKSIDTLVELVKSKL